MNNILVKSHKNIPKNQILKIELSDDIFYIPYDSRKVNKAKYFWQFLISTIIAVICLFILYFNIQKTNKQEQISQKLLNNYSLTTLYQNASNSNKNQSVVYENPFVIGMIEISKIKLNYPILSESNSDLLKISLCRFAGPTPNEIGNLCIAGHNYVDNRFFSRIKELEINDKIEIYDLNGRKITYYIYDKYEVLPNDLSCVNQNVGNNKIVTLLTCNNVNGKRTIIKAKENIF